MPDRILIVEGDASIGRCIEAKFLEAGRPVRHVTRGEERCVPATTEKFFLRTDRSAGLFGHGAAFASVGA